MNRYTTENALIECRDSFIAILKSSTFKSTKCSTVFFSDDDIVANIDKTTSKVSSIGSLHSGVRQTFTCTVRSDEVFKHRHSFLEVRKNWVFNNLSTFSTCFLRFSHKTTNTRELLNLVFRTTGSRVEHHEYRIETLIGFGHFLQKDITNIVVYVSPCINYLIVTLVVGDETHVIVVHDFLNLTVTLLYKVLLLWWNDDVVEVE